MSKVFDESLIKLYNEITAYKIDYGGFDEDGLDPKHCINFKNIDNNERCGFYFDYICRNEINLDIDYQILGYYLEIGSTRDKIKLCKRKNGRYIIKCPYFNTKEQDYMRYNIELAKGDIIELKRVIEEYKKNNRVNQC